MKKSTYAFLLSLIFGICLIMVSCSEETTSPLYTEGNGALSIVNPDSLIGDEEEPADPLNIGRCCPWNPIRWNLCGKTFFIHFVTVEKETNRDLSTIFMDFWAGGTHYDGFYQYTNYTRSSLFLNTIYIFSSGSLEIDPSEVEITMTVDGVLYQSNLEEFNKGIIFFTDKYTHPSIHSERGMIRVDLTMDIPGYGSGRRLFWIHAPVPNSTGTNEGPGSLD